MYDTRGLGKRNSTQSNTYKSQSSHIAFWGDSEWRTVEQLLQSTKPHTSVTSHYSIWANKQSAAVESLAHQMCLFNRLQKNDNSIIFSKTNHTELQSCKHCAEVNKVTVYFLEMHLYEFDLFVISGNFSENNLSVQKGREVSHVSCSCSLWWDSQP